MIELIILFAMLFGMAKRKGGGRRRMGTYIRGNVDVRMALGTLAGDAAVVQGFNDSVEERSLVSSLVATYSLEAMTPGEGIGPIMVCVAHSDYSAAEIEQWIENSASWKEGDLVQQEIANRKIRRIGQFDDVSADSISVLNDGKMIKTKLNWILTTGQTLDLVAYNLGDAALATTDPSLNVQGHINLWPR